MIERERESEMEREREIEKRRAKAMCYQRASQRNTVQAATTKHKRYQIKRKQKSKRFRPRC